LHFFDSELFFLTIIALSNGKRKIFAEAEKLCRGRKRGKIAGKVGELWGNCDETGDKLGE
jgi:hypothetical protein